MFFLLETSIQAFYSNKSTRVEDNDEKTTRTTTSVEDKDNLFVRNRRFCRPVVVFFVFISFRCLSRLSSVRIDCFFVVILSFLTSFFFK